MMIRALLTLAMPAAVALSATAPLIGTGILPGSRGEPLLVSAQPNPLHNVRFEGDCAHARPAKGEAFGGVSEIVGVTLGTGEGGSAITIRRIPTGEPIGGERLVVLLDAAGKVLFVGDAAALTTDMAEPASSAHCGALKKPGPI